MKNLRLLIADDHPIFRDGLRLLISSVDGLEVVGEAASGDEVVAQALSLRPDVILMDIKMPGLNGIEATRRIVQQSPEIRVVILSMFEEDESIFAALRAGARGYLLKGARQEEVLRAIQAAAQGEALFGPQVAAKMPRLFSQPRPAFEGGGSAADGGFAASEPFPGLTSREREVLDLLAQRLSNDEIAQRLVLSPKTVRNHVSNIFHKLHVSHRAEAILAARAAGLGAAQT